MFYGQYIFFLSISFCNKIGQRCSFCDKCFDDFKNIYIILLEQKSLIQKTITILNTVKNAARNRFHQHFTRNFFEQKCFAQIVSTYILALKFFGKRISAQKLLVKCWWNLLLFVHLKKYFCKINQNSDVPVVPVKVEVINVEIFMSTQFLSIG